MHSVTLADEPRWRRLEPDARRSNILTVAIRAFGEQPYSAVQMATIAKDAGVTRGLLNHYFGTKRDLYLEVVREMLFVPAREESDLPTGSRRDRIEQLVDWLMSVLATHGRTWVAVGVGGAGGDTELQAILEEADDLAAQRVLDAVGPIDDAAHNTAIAAVRAYGGLVKAAVREWVDRRSLTQNEVREILVVTLDALLRTIVDANSEVDYLHPSPSICEGRSLRRSPAPAKSTEQLPEQPHPDRA